MRRRFPGFVWPISFRRDRSDCHVARAARASRVHRTPLLESLESRQLFSTFTVTTAANSGAGSLRDAITRANNNAGADVINFKIGTGAKTISPTSALPAITGPTVVDATTQPGYAGKPLIELNGASAGSTANGLKLAAGSSTIKGFVINRFGQSGILALTKSGNKFSDNYIGTDRTGAAALPNKSHGIMLWSAGNIVDHNLISGNTNAGVFCYTAAASGNTITANQIGTDATGTKSIPNFIGVQLNGAPSNTIGGLTSAARNVISGNTRDGVLMVTTGAHNNLVEGNYIGVSAAGTARLGNGWYGVEISQPDNLVGGTTTAARNIISANGVSGVVMYLATGVNNRVQGNYIGTDPTGTKDLGNSTAGVEITNNACYNTVGGDTKSAANLIAANKTFGVGIYNNSNHNTVRYNTIGISAAGRALPNARHGTLISTSSSNMVCDNTVALCATYKCVWISSGTGNTAVRNVAYLNITSGASIP